MKWTVQILRMIKVHERAIPPSIDDANPLLQDEWLGQFVWNVFVTVKFIEGKPKAGVSPGLDVRFHYP